MIGLFLVLIICIAVEVSAGTYEPCSIVKGRLTKMSVDGLSKYGPGSQHTCIMFIGGGGDMIVKLKINSVGVAIVTSIATVLRKSNLDAGVPTTAVVDLSVVNS